MSYCSLRPIKSGCDCTNISSQRRRPPSHHSSWSTVFVLPPLCWQKRHTCAVNKTKQLTYDKRENKFSFLLPLQVLLLAEEKYQHGQKHSFPKLACQLKLSFKKCQKKQLHTHSCTEEADKHCLRCEPSDRSASFTQLRFLLKKKKNPYL